MSTPSILPAPLRPSLSSETRAAGQFMSPEQLTGDPVTPATDVFAFGAVLTYAATGTGPFSTGSAQSLNFRIAYEEPRLDGLPEQGLEIVARCLAKDPEQRPDVSTLIRELADTAGDMSRTPTEIVTNTAVWLPDQVAAAVSATVTAAAVPAPAVPHRPKKAPAPVSPRKPAHPKPAADAPVPARPAVSAEPPHRPSAGTSPTRPRKAEAPAIRPALTGEVEVPTTPVTPAAPPHPWAVRRVLLLSIACIAFVLAMCLPFSYRASVFAFLFVGWWPWWSPSWPFGGTWPFVLTAGLAVTSCAAVMAMLRRFPTGPVPGPVRRLHYLATTLAGGLLSLHVALGLGARGDLSFLESGAWFFVLGCAALVAGTVRLSGPKPSAAPIS
ncbi:protein kinase domain-containing protein [Streptomyces rhizosphaerihabitans]|uniref:protein kinase domain-containing protein n=1 Tax=Streptomyces rhizosphaerihabitans TaxID=1266770 RepID=UPI0028F72447|nr:protein kinase [Streptomyces rhizosphaerihabitans]